MQGKAAATCTPFIITTVHHPTWMGPMISHSLRVLFSRRPSAGEKNGWLRYIIVAFFWPDAPDAIRVHICIIDALVGVVVSFLGGGGKVFRIVEFENMATKFPHGPVLFKWNTYWGGRWCFRKEFGVERKVRIQPECV